MKDLARQLEDVREAHREELRGVQERLQAKDDDLSKAISTMDSLKATEKKLREQIEEAYQNQQISQS